MEEEAIWRDTRKSFSHQLYILYKTDITRFQVWTNLKTPLMEKKNTTHQHTLFHTHI